MEATAVETLAEISSLLLPAEVSTVSSHCAADHQMGTWALIASRPRQPALSRVLGISS